MNAGFIVVAFAWDGAAAFGGSVATAFAGVTAAGFAEAGSEAVCNGAAGEWAGASLFAGADACGACGGVSDADFADGVSADSGVVAFDVAEGDVPSVSTDGVTGSAEVELVFSGLVTGSFFVQAGVPRCCLNILARLARSDACSDLVGVGCVITCAGGVICFLQDGFGGSAPAAATLFSVVDGCVFATTAGMCGWAF